MTPVDPPPPLFAAPPTNQSRRSCLIVGAAVGGSLLVILGLAVLGITMFRKVAGRDPEPFAGYGKVKRVKPVSLGWSLYAFPDFRYRVALPATPVAQPFTNWSTDTRLSIKAWAAYSVELKNAGAELEGYDYRFNQPLSAMAEAEANSYRREARNKHLRSKTAETKIAGNTGLVQTLTYVQEDFPAISRVYYFQDRGRTLILRFHYWEESKVPSEKEITRIVSSIELE
jgi:hypothetical protein